MSPVLIGINKSETIGKLSNSQESYESQKSYESQDSYESTNNEIHLEDGSGYYYKLL
jgi:hypothetical protein